MSCGRGRRQKSPAPDRRPPLAGGPGLTETFVRGNLRFVETYEAVLEALGDRTRRQIVQRPPAGSS